MKKITALLMSIMFSLTLASSAFAVGQNSDEETACESVNQQSHEESSPASSGQSVDQSGSGTTGV